MTTPSKPTSFSATWQELQDRRFIVVLLIGFSSGLPWALHGSVLTLWLQDSGFNRSTIGYIGAIASVYAFNWMWSPLIDGFRLPILGRLFDQRRSWIIFTQSLMLVALIGMGLSPPDQSLLVLSLFSLFFAIASATQDIAVDSYRVLLFRKEELDRKIPLASALATAGWWSGYGFIGGALALWLGGEFVGLSWSGVYFVMAGVMGLLIVLVSLCPPPVDGGVAPETASAEKAPLQWFRQSAIEPFLEFFRRCGPALAIGILLFLFSFRLGEAMLGRMSLVFYRELGFTIDQLALYQKLSGGFFTIVFSLLGAFVNARFGVVKGMLVGGIAMASSNLMLALMAVVGPEPWLFLMTLVIDNFTSAFATVAAVSFISYFASRTYTGTQFALMSSISNFGRTTLAAGSGVIIDGMGGNWVAFFILTAVMVIPALLLLIWIGKVLRTFNLGQGSRQAGGPS